MNVAECTCCGMYTSNASQINQRCTKTVKGKRCKGTFRSMVAPGDWEVCSKCSGINSSKCGICQGTGQINTRK